MIIYPNNYNGDRQFWFPFLLGGLGGAWCHSSQTSICNKSKL